MRRSALLLLYTALSGCVSTYQFEGAADSSGCAIERVAVEQGTAQFSYNGLSPDGRLLAVGWEKGADRGAYLLDLRKGVRTPLPAAINNAASFTPDGSGLIAAVTAEGKRTDIVEYDRATGATHFLAAHPSAEFLPSYSKDGKRILFNSYRTGRSDIYLLDRDSGSLEQLTTFNGYEAHARFSPDETRIVFHREVAPGDYDIVELNLRTREERTLMGGAGEQSYPSWSPDGRLLAFSSDHASASGKNDLYVMDAQGRILHRLTDEPASDSYANWTPNGWLYFVSMREGHGVYRMRLSKNGECHRSRPDSMPVGLQLEH